MDLLTKTDGYSLIEALVGITILGLLVGFVLMVSLRLMSNPKLTLQHKALLIAENEVNYCQSISVEKDTCYLNSNNTLTVKRTVKIEDNSKIIIITIKHTKSEQVLLSYSFVSAR